MRVSVLIVFDVMVFSVYIRPVSDYFFDSPTHQDDGDEIKTEAEKIQPGGGATSGCHSLNHHRYSENNADSHQNKCNPPNQLNTFFRGPVF